MFENQVNVLQYQAIYSFFPRIVLWVFLLSGSQSIHSFANAA